MSRSSNDGHIFKIKNIQLSRITVLKYMKELGLRSVVIPKKEPILKENTIKNLKII